MYALQNLRDFIDNPMGKGSNAIPSRPLIKSDLNRRYDALTRKNKLDFDIYRDKEDYYFHFKIPSEAEGRVNYYDTVLQFTPGDEDFKNDKNLNRYNVKFFSNNPGFVYTFAYAFNLYGLFIDSLKSKYDDKVLADMPIIRNPAEVISYEKTTYFASFHILQNSRLMDKIVINTMAKPFKVNDFKKRIKNSDEILIEIKKETSRLREIEDKKKKLSQTGSSRRGSTVDSKDKIVSKGRTKGNGANSIKPKIQSRKSSIKKIRPK